MPVVVVPVLNRRNAAAWKKEPLHHIWARYLRLVQKEMERAREFPALHARNQSASAARLSIFNIKFSIYWKNYSLAGRCVFQDKV
jgi:hypothetical protein